LRFLRRSGWLLALLLSAAATVAVACGDYAKPAAVSLASPVSAEPTSSAPAATATLLSTALPVPTPSATSTLVPTARPTVLISVPDRWTEAASAAIALPESAHRDWEWKLAEVDGPAAHVVMKSGNDGILAGQRPLALAVPFTAEAEAVSLAEAENILVNGRPGLLVIDYGDMPPGYRALRVGGQLPHEDGYALQQEWSLQAAPGFETAAMELARSLRAQVEYDPLIHIAAVGDIMLDRALGYAIEQGDLAYPFARVAKTLSEADITVGNLESALGDAGQPAAKSYAFRAPPAAAESLALAGFDVMSLANNHAMDFGSETLAQALALLERQGIATVGAGSTVQDARSAHVIDVSDISVAFLGYVNVPVEVSGFDTATWEASADTPGLAWARPEDIAADVSAARKIADLVVVSLHSGYEYVHEPSAEQRAASEAAVAAGAQLVIGHHAHVLQGIGFLGEGAIVYGLGNFAFEIDGDPSTAILHVWLDRNGVRQLELVPAIIQFGGQPRLAEDWEQAQIRRQVYRLTDLINLQTPYANAGG
jgi:poly-gamma-glutamate capsule biosynthesis protein CapA/YwtB (metallophosphatase superfamily)